MIFQFCIQRTGTISLHAVLSKIFERPLQLDFFLSIVNNDSSCIVEKVRLVQRHQQAVGHDRTLGMLRIQDIPGAGLLNAMSSTSLWPAKDCYSSLAIICVEVPSRKRPAFQGSFLG